MKPGYVVIALWCLGCAGKFSAGSPVDRGGLDSGSRSPTAGSGSNTGAARDSGQLDTGTGTGGTHAGADAGKARDAGQQSGRDASTNPGSGSDASSGTGGSGNSGKDSGSPPATEISLPPIDAAFDYQLGGSYAPPASVKIISRDRLEQPAAGLYNICYINGFQVQPDEKDEWLSQHADLVLRDDSGDPVIDQDWDEMLIDVSTADKRTRLAEIEGAWIARCAQDGFDAVEVDNLDAYDRSGGRLTQDNAVAFISLLAKKAHASKLAIAQKNSAELLGRRDEMDTDFAVAEECNRYDECGDFTDAYGDHVLVIEYTRSDFDTGCEDFPNLSIVLRDLDLVTKGQGGYVFDGC